MTKLTALMFALVTTTAACKKEEPKQEAPKQEPKKEEPKPADKPADKTAPAPAGDAKLSPIAGAYELDSSHSAVNFKISHMNASSLLGRFNKVTGTFTLDGDLAKSKVEITVAAGSIFTAEKKRDDHLKGPDFLNTAQFPDIKFTSTAIKAEGDKYSVTGDLELHGVKKPVTGVFSLVGSGKNMMDDKVFLAGFIGDIKIKRTDFGMDKMVGVAGDEIELTISVEGMKK